ncbi:MAG: HupE/UreJ family protein [Litoreibacter sp.]
MKRIGFFLECFTHCAMRLLTLSMFLVVTIAGAGQTHEIRPAIADIDVNETAIAITLRLTAETLLAGINLENIEDTDEAPEAEKYDALRADPPEVLADQLRAAWSELSTSLIVNAGDTPISLALDGVEVDQIGDVELPRDTVVTLSAPLPTDDSPVQVGWIAANGPLIVRQVGGDDDAYSGFLDNGALSEPLPRNGTISESGWAVFARYIGVGFDHIIPKGLDHILFVLGLFFLSTQLRPLLTQVTIFTVAHTITLALAATGVVSISGAIVEPLIAASIVYVAIENVFAKNITPWRPFIIFGFGLLHGLGFASVLGEFGLAPGRFISALIGFNVGVEVGQLTVIALAFLAVGFWFGRKEWYRRVISIPASLAIALVGAYWAVERVFF